jgi:uncharacterized membrane protein YvbJ
MFCTKCGIELPDGSNFCNNCGNNLNGASSNTEKPTPTALIIASWVVLLIRFIPMPYTLSLIFDIIALVGAIWLIVSKNKTGRINGIILLVIWIIGFLAGFVSSYR